jgi:hypothetical protein
VLVSKPLMRLLLATLISILVKMSPNKLYKVGDKGSPCLNPFPVLKKGLSFPFTSYHNTFQPTDPSMAKTSGFKDLKREL